MKNKTPLSLLELLLMVLIFSLSAALCLRAFVYSGKLSRQDAAAVLAESRAQSAAEVLKSVKGDTGKASEILGGAAEGQILVIGYDKDWNAASTAQSAVYTLKATVEREAYLGRAGIVISDSSGNVIYTLSASWQEDLK